MSRQPNRRSSYCKEITSPHELMQLMMMFERSDEREVYTWDRVHLDRLRRTVAHTELFRLRWGGGTTIVVEQGHEEEEEYDGSR